ncbi:MAG: Lrp/AsnC family transcriptional regulator [Candidatus Aenigmarchaeota archaeon]|nr:Lrp/AsnC family transcriptional regulator [Candidatus Aenigmarchaeota archaeon]
MRFQQGVAADRQVELDLKDRKILAMLSRNARQPLSGIAPAVRLSRDAVRYRIANLEKAGVIQGYRTVIDAPRFGYGAYHLFLQLNRPARETEDRLVELFKGNPHTRAAIKFSGKFDFEVALIAKSVGQFDSILTDILNECSAVLQDYEIMAITKPYHSGVFPRSFIEGLLPERRKLREYEPDSKDVKILAAMADDARMPTYRISEKTGMSTDAVLYRIRKMKEGGIITGFVPVISYSVIGYTVIAVLLNMQPMSSEAESKLGRFLGTDDSILWAVKTVGRYNTLMYICTRNPGDIHKTIISLRSHFAESIRNYETLIAYEEYKYTYFPVCLRGG